jgi:triosephosphate isomerase
VTSHARRPLLAGNWKMNLTHLEAIGVVQKLVYRMREGDAERVEVVVCPPFTDLRSVQIVRESDSMPIELGAQNCYFEDAGAFTGEVSPVMLAKLDVRYVIVGHSERRRLFGETDEVVRRKVDAVLRHGMVPILCIGEDADERDRQEVEEVVRSQLRLGLAGWPKAGFPPVVVAYEPIWAIGTGRAATASDAQEVAALVRAELAELADVDKATGTRILYGGSVTPSNVGELLHGPDVDGALVGGASLDGDSMARMVATIADSVAPDGH